MTTIYLMEAGHYLLGIDTASVIRKLPLDRFINEEHEDEASLIHLTSFLDQNISVLPKENLVVIEVKGPTQPSLMIIDRIIAKIKAPDRFQALPLLYPEHTRQCFPQIMVDNNQPVLLLDPTGLEVVQLNLTNNFGLVSMETLRNRENNYPLNNDHPNPDKKPAIPAEQIEVKLDPATYKAIIFWVIGEYLQGDRKIMPSKLFNAHKESLALQDVGDELLQNIIDKTVQKCRTMPTASLRQLREKKSDLTP